MCRANMLADNAESRAIRKRRFVVPEESHFSVTSPGGTKGPAEQLTGNPRFTGPTSLLTRTAFAKTLCSMLLHRTTQCFESSILGSRKQTGVIENGPFKHLFWTFIVARKSAPQVQIRSSG